MSRATRFNFGAVGLAALAGPAAAAEPFYFHKVAVERSVYVANIAECNELAGGVRTPQYNVYAPGLAGAAASGFFSGFFGSRERRGIVESVLRTCMTDKGYRRIEASTEIRRELARLPETERLERLFSLASAPDPVGKVLPQ